VPLQGLTADPEHQAVEQVTADEVWHDTNLAFCDSAAVMDSVFDNRANVADDASEQAGKAASV